MDRFYLLDIARGMAAIAVAIFHYKLFYEYNISSENFIPENQPFYHYIKMIYEHGWIAVQFFFLLSGFIFFRLYLKKIKEKNLSFYNFLILRISRLYPLHFITLIIVLIIYLILKSNNFINPIRADLEHFIYNLFLIHEWGLNSYASFNEPSWSISVELLMYIIFFYLALKTNIIFCSFLVILISSILFFKFKFLGYGGYCFFIGGLSYVLLENFKIGKKNKTLFLCILIFFSGIISYYFIESSILNKIIILTIFFPSLINLLYLINNCSPKFGKQLSLIGDISYSIYLIHFPLILLSLMILNILNLEINFNSMTIFCTYLIFTFLTSFFSYNFLEIPLKKILRKKYIKNDK
tara:strand:+ start:634 stop:1689 length:1056 start_codon:yes stop_codon:yes gene_type:complete